MGKVENGLTRIEIFHDLQLHCSNTISNYFLKQIGEIFGILEPFFFEKLGFLGLKNGGVPPILWTKNSKILKEIDSKISKIPPICFNEGSFERSRRDGLNERLISLLAARRHREHGLSKSKICFLTKFAHKNGHK